VLVLLEAGACVFFHLARDRFAFADPTQYVLDPARAAGLEPHFDATLGWTHRYPTRYQERPRPSDFGRPFLASFGDSYTHCDEVADGETWQTYLADAQQADVYNFGVGGYGPDQALLRYRLVSRQLTTPVVSLGFVLENINRVVNRYRPFYYPETGIPLTKPRFVLERGALVLLPNPLATAADVRRLSDPAFVHAIGARDFWYASADLPRLGFPYTQLLVSPALWQQALEGGRAQRSEINERPARNLWKDADARGLLLAILDAFVSEATSSGSRALILVLPGKPNVEARRAGRPIPGFEPVRRHCAERGYACFDGVAALAGTPEPTAALFRPGGHLSPRGNRALAAALRSWLRSSHLLESRGPARSAPEGGHAVGRP